MKRSVFYLFALCVITACSQDIVGELDIQPDIFPDYKEVTVPSNIAPMNFSVLSDDECRWGAFVTAGAMELFVRADDGLISFPRKTWKRIISEGKGGEISVRLCMQKEDGWYGCKPFVMNVAEEEVDPYLAYRLITPGYSLWQDMSIRQRNLESFKEKVIYSNAQGRRNCVNCHSFCERDPEQMLLHMRSEYAGTYMFRNGTKEKLDTKTDMTMSAVVYPYWHPSGDYVAFSVNKTNQMLHVSDPNRIEVFDEDSDVVVYDVEHHEIVTSAVIASSGAFETFPAFSPDGKSMYYCTAKAVEPMPERYKDVVYSLCRIDFDPDECSFGETADTLYNAEQQGGSVSFPRISPDGRYLVFTLSGYGNFSIWHKDADLYCIDLEEGSISRMDALNSDNVESYHSWSSDSRWLVFSSRRDDGLYTRPYVAYVDENGKACKPFLIPQKNPKAFYDSQMFSYNIPEFVEGRIDVDGREISDLASTSDGIQISFRKD